jgi:hypothetical protein
MAFRDLEASDAKKINQHDTVRAVDLRSGLTRRRCDLTRPVRRMKMKFLKTMCAAILLLAAVPALAQRVYIEYDQDYDGSAVKTFAWAETAETSVASTQPLLHSRIVTGIEHYLALSGAHEDTNNPDVYVTYHTSTRKEISVDVSNYGYGYSAGWGSYGRRYPSYGGSYGTSSATVRSYDKGTLVVDIWDAASKKLVWRGTAVDITVSDNPERMKKRVDKALKKIVDKWRKLKTKAG